MVSCCCSGLAVSEGSVAGPSTVIENSRFLRGCLEGRIEGEAERGLLMGMNNLTTKNNNLAG
jgi:hypothetical protein